ncbi:hypothetical protein [Calidifontibacillus erzurumensis]|uniref:hypothetical protein n=1 Tax=Calidifontibacillus erzurumensis TaxID=2741433 RepID=UPI0035B55933
MSNEGKGFLKELEKEIRKIFKKIEKTPFAISLGPILRNPNTEEVIVSIFNGDKHTQKITVSVADTTNCIPVEFQKEAYLCGKLITPPLPPFTIQNTKPQYNLQQNSENTPLTVGIPPSQLLIVHARATPPPPMVTNATYNVLVFTPTRNITISSAGVNQQGEPQEGNTVTMNQTEIARTILLDSFIGEIEF